MESVPAVPPIYVRLDPPARVAWTGRLVSLTACLGCLAVLITAASIRPSPFGTGTHQQLGMLPCSFLERTGIPCAGCGMTTSFAWFVRGNLVASFYSQPFGMILALLTCCGVWVGGYLAYTGKPAWRVIRGPIGYYVIVGSLLAAFGWAWKIAIHVDGRDGW